MCGRYTLRRPGQEVASAYAAGIVFATQPRFNIAPTQPVLVIRAGEFGREALTMRWGLPPARSGGPPLLNARAETAATRGAFRAALAARRCLIPADGFYEWVAEEGAKRARLFTLHDDALFAFAGLWEPIGAGSVVILTVAANELVRDVHDRMPAILTPADADAWLNQGQSDPAGLLRPYPAEAMTVRRVGPAVNSARNEGPRCIEPASPPQPTLFGD